ncbi:hypothetical protein ACFWHR_14910 [Leucobacter sp. NPDC058333]|uniref:hypothetical protein n=1 Tax=Leucobacter sp. NPDC058333 TaxID=3346450 RepID=UPI003650E257
MAAALTFDSLPPYMTGYMWFGFFLSLWVMTAFCVSLSFDTKEDQIRVRTKSACTWVSQEPLVHPLILIGFSLIFTSFGAYSAWFVTTGLVQNDGNPWGSAPRLAWLMSLFFLGSSVYAWRQVARYVRANPGIRLAPERIGIMHKHEDVYLPWSEVVRVTAEAVAKPAGRKKTELVPSVRIETDQGRVYYVEAFELGSDPNAVAALVRFYLGRPQDRELLTNLEEAIRHFSDAQIS